MTAISRVRASVGAIVLASLLGACSPGNVATPAPSVVATAIPAVTSSAAASGTAAASASATVLPSATTSAAPSPSPSAVASCAPVASKGALPSDRLVKVVVSQTADADLVTFRFGHSSIPPNPAGPPKGALDVATPPYTFGASGLPIAMDGQHVLDLRFDHMSLVADTGDLTYDGPTEFKAAGPVFRHAAEYDSFEGHENWYLGYDGGGCVTLTRSGQDVIIAFARG